MNDLMSGLEWCMDKEWNAELPTRTPLCTQVCEDFLHLPLDKTQSPIFQTLEHEPLLVLGVDLQTLDENYYTNNATGNFFFLFFFIAVLNLHTMYAYKVPVHFLRF